METSIIIARIIGLLYLIVGAGLLLNQKHYRRVYKEASHDHFGMYIAGILALVFGLFIVIFHNEWTFGWEILVTIFGWIALLKGAMIMLFPDSMTRKIKKMIKSKSILKYSGTIAVILGVIFTYFGFFA